MTADRSQTPSGALGLAAANPVPTTLLATASVVLAIIVWQLLSRPAISTVMQIDAQTRSASYVVTNPAFARINFPYRVFLFTGDPQASECIRGVVAPSERAEVRYQVVDGHKLQISFTSTDGGTRPSGRFIGPDGQEFVLGSNARIIAGMIEECGDRGPLTLPIWGEATLGALQQVHPEAASRIGVAPILFDGRIDLFTVSRSSREGEPAELFPTESYALPAGSIVRALPAGDVPGIMRGFAVYTPQASTNDLQTLRVSLSTEAERLSLRRWGSDLDGEIIELGALSKLFGDPDHALRQAFLAFVLVVIGATTGVAQMILEANDLRVKRPANRTQIPSVRTEDPSSDDFATNGEMPDQNDAPPPERDR